MKKLTQAVFDLPECPVWAVSVAVDADGGAWWYNQEAVKLRTANPEHRSGMWVFADKRNGFRKARRFSSGYDTTNWQQSAIDRVLIGD